MSLFSIFDPSPSASFSVQWKWSCAFVFLLFFNWQFFSLPSSKSALGKKALEVLFYSVCDNMKRTKDKSSLLCSLFLIIFLVSVLSLFPPIFAVTSHMSFNLSFALPLWLGGVIGMFVTNWKVSLAHFLPRGAPFSLSVFLVLIESVSMLIRPITLSIRLMANVMAGHLILTLCGNLFSSFPTTNCLILSFLASLLGVFELGVNLVQAYVFMALVMLYWKENQPV